MDMELLESQLAELPLYGYFFIDPKTLEFSERIRWICKNECPMYNKTWACPPAVGAVAECKAKCTAYENCLMIATITEVDDITDIEETLSTRPEYEAVTNQVQELMAEQQLHHERADVPQHRTRGYFQGTTYRVAGVCQTRKQRWSE